MHDREIAHTSTPILDKKSDHFEYIVVGGGIAGLSATWELARQNKSVLLISDRKMSSRKDFLRPQLIRQTEVILDYLVKMLVENNEEIGDDFRKIHTTSVAIKDIERFIFERLKKFEKYISYLPLSVVTNIVLKNGQVTVKSADGGIKEFSFDNLIATDGAHHATGNILAKKEAGIPRNFSPKSRNGFFYESLYPADNDMRSEKRKIMVHSME